MLTAFSASEPFMECLPKKKKKIKKYKGSKACSQNSWSYTAGNTWGILLTTGGFLRLQPAPLPALPQDSPTRAPDH